MGGHKFGMRSGHPSWSPHIVVRLVHHPPTRSTPRVPAPRSPRRTSLGLCGYGRPVSWLLSSPSSVPPSIPAAACPFSFPSLNPLPVDPVVVGQCQRRWPPFVVRPMPWAWPCGSLAKPFIERAAGCKVTTASLSSVCSYGWGFGRRVGAAACRVRHGIRALVQYLLPTSFVSSSVVGFLLLCLAL